MLRGWLAGGQAALHLAAQPCLHAQCVEPHLSCQLTLHAVPHTPHLPLPAWLQGHQAVFDVSEFQLDALAGSDTLKAEVITQGEHRSSDKSLQRASGRLLAALMQGDTPQQRLAMPLLVLLAQQRKLIVLQSQVRMRTWVGGWAGGMQLAGMGELWGMNWPCCITPLLSPIPCPQSVHLKLIAELYDKCQEVCTQVGGPPGSASVLQPCSACQQVCHQVCSSYLSVG